MYFELFFMKFLLKTILKYYLKYLAKLTLFIYRPLIIAVAGSTNKYFTRQYIKEALEKEGYIVRSSEKSFNTEIGLPLSILNLPSGYNSYKKWLQIIKETPKAIFCARLPKILILEFGVSDPGDMKYLLSIVKPHIVVITEITQRYLEGFTDMDNLVDEYKILLSNLKQDNFCIFNSDNSKISEIVTICKSKKESFGFNQTADWIIKQTERRQDGQYITITHNNIINNYKIPRFGKHHIYAFTASLIVKSYAIKKISEN